MLAVVIRTCSMLFNIIHCKCEVEWSRKLGFLPDLFYEVLYSAIKWFALSWTVESSTDSQDPGINQHQINQLKEKMKIQNTQVV